MAFRHLAWAREQRTGSTSKKALLMALAEHADDEAYCYVRRETLARILEMGMSTVTRLVSSLEQQGLIRVEKRSDRVGRQISNGYWLAMENQPAQIEHPPAHGRAGSLLTSDHPLTAISNSQPTHTTDSTPKNRGDEHFERLWACYPKRSGSNSKRAALKAYNARKRAGHTPQEMATGVLAYSIWCEEQGRIGTQYVMQASTFLGPDLHFKESWDVAPPAPGGGVKRKQQRAPDDFDVEGMLASGQIGVIK